MISKNFSNYAKKIMFILTDGVEEIETVTISNVLRRAKNEVRLFKVANNENKNDLIINCARGLKIVQIFFILL